MPHLSRPPSRDLSPHTSHRNSSRPSSQQESLTIEETFHLAAKARRRTSDKFVREDLRLKLGHANVLEHLLLDIARRSPPVSPSMPKTTMASINGGDRVQIPSDPEPKRTPPVPMPSGVDELGFAYDDEDEDEMASLSLTRTASRRD